MSTPPEHRKIDEELSKIRHDKDAAIGRSNFEEAKKLADKESDALERKAALSVSGVPPVKRSSTSSTRT